ncbi:MAG: DNA polymerase III subunit chi [Sphingomonadaceae bacterium]|nr:DNA polymerase III subunit chi [Sphingomonadaceae bacterium]
MRVDFYQLARAPVAQVLPRIAVRILGEGGRLLVTVGDEEAARALDRALWVDAPTSFLPHGRAGAEGAADQPVLIATDCVAANGARNLALADGAWRDEALGFDRAFHFFDEESVAAARDAWRMLKARADVEPRYWRQDEDGRWQQMA